MDQYQYTSRWPNSDHCQCCNKTLTTQTPQIQVDIRYWCVECFHAWGLRLGYCNHCYPDDNNGNESSLSNLDRDNNSNNDNDNDNNNDSDNDNDNDKSEN